MSTSMISKMRGKVGGYIVAAIIGFIALVFAFEGVFRPSSTQGLHEGSIAGSVNGEPISIGEYQKAVERKIEFLKGIMGGKVSEEQMKMFRIREGVFQELVQQKLMAQAALESGRLPSDEAVRHEIMKLSYFQKDGKFDPNQYRAVLEANRYTPALFEKMIREQLAVEDWTKSFGTQIRISDAEVKEEFLLSQNQRTYKYVSIPADSPKQGDLTPKQAAEKVAAMLKVDKKSDAAVNTFLKPFSTDVRYSPSTAENTAPLPGVEYDQPEIAKALFSVKDGLEIGKAKVFESPTRVTVIMVTEMKKPDLAKLDGMRDDLLQQLRNRKERELMSAVMKKLTEKGKIESNPAIVSSDEGPSEG